jgi:putative cell wall-binding protein
MRRIAALVALLAPLLVVAALPGSSAAETRLSGSDNVATAIAWSNELFDSSEFAVLARNDSFADALAAGALSGHLDAPFLVTPTASLDARVRSELDRLGAETVLIIGGTAAVSEGVESSLQSSGFTTERLAGANRVDTAVQVAQTFGPVGAVVLARAFGTGTAGFADSLGGGSLAASLGAPLLLTDTASLSEATHHALMTLAPETVHIVGGTAAVSDAAADEVRALGIDVERHAGTNRFATAAAVLDASGADGAIALIDGVHADSWVSGFAASSAGGILLTNGADLPDETAAALGDTADAPLVCAPQVAAATCGVADDMLNGDDLVLAEGRMRIPAIDVGDADLTALPIGDDHIDRDSAQVGDLFLCSTFPTDGGGTMTEGPWMHGTTWDFTEKLWVRGQVTWSAAEATVTIDGDERVLAGNLLPVGHTTGTYPIADSDPAQEYDANPSSIVENDYEIRIPANPTPNSGEQCVGGEVGFALSGVVINSAVDAMGRDALAHELQDHCQGHPNNSGYHYHSISVCIDDGDNGHSALVGYALDGFGIYGTRSEHGVVVTNEDLDECHGHTHTITWDGASVSMYHYHATWEFPYAVGCFRGTNAISGPVLGGDAGGTGGGGQMPPPPR